MSNPYRHLITGNAPEHKQRTAAQNAPDIVDTNGAYNPPAFNGRQALQQAIPSFDLSAPRMFNASGELNAQDNVDALKQIEHLYNNVLRSQQSASFFRAASTLSSEEKNRMITAAMSTREGREVVGAELLQPIKDILDYEGWSRKVFRTRQVAPTEIWRIPRDVRATAAIVGQDGQGIETQARGSWLQPSTFKITAYATADIEDMLMVSYDLLGRMQDTARQEIELQEDLRGVALLDTMSQIVNPVTTFTTLGVAALESVRYEVEKHRLTVEKFLIHRQELSDIVTTMSGQIDLMSQREILLTGHIGNFFGARIFTAAGAPGSSQEVVPAGTFYAVVEPDYLGEMGIRMDLQSEEFSTANQRLTKKGWAFVELVGFGGPGTRGVAKGMK